jgi:uncharacterized membrane protein YeaQ/YmgE (transglycosylase-associated protein family)
MNGHAQVGVGCDARRPHGRAKEIAMGWITWIVLGLVVGALAKVLMPGKDPGGLVMTTLLGIVGAVIGGWLSTQLGLGDVSGFNLPSLLIATAGAMLLLFANRMLRGGRS